MSYKESKDHKNGKFHKKFLHQLNMQHYLDMVLRRIFLLEEEFKQLNVWHCKNPNCTKSLCVNYKNKLRNTENKLDELEAEYNRVLMSFRRRHEPNYISFATSQALSSQNRSE